MVEHAGTEYRNMDSYFNISLPILTMKSYSLYEINDYIDRSVLWLYLYYLLSFNKYYVLNFCAILSLPEPNENYLGHNLNPNPLWAGGTLEC